MNLIVHYSPYIMPCLESIYIMDRVISEPCYKGIVFGGVPGGGGGMYFTRFEPSQSSGWAKMGGL